MRPAAWFVAAIAVMIAVDALVPGPHWLARPWNLAGLLVTGAGVVVHISASNRFRHHHTTTAALARPATLVTDGPYRYSRNPMYLGGVLMLLGLAMVLGSTTPLLGLALWVVWMQAHFIRREETLLRDAFGETYDAYRAQVRRWL